EKRQRKNAPIEFPPWRVQHDFPFTLAGSGVADRQANVDCEAECAENGRHWILAHEMFGTLECPARLVFGLVPLLAHLRGNFFFCSTKLLTPSCANVFGVWLRLWRWKRFVPHKIVFVRIHTSVYRIPRGDCVSRLTES